MEAPISQDLANVHNQTSWWYTYPSEKYEFVNWDYYSKYVGELKMFQTTTQQSMCFPFRDNG